MKKLILIPLCLTLFSFYSCKEPIIQPETFTHYYLATQCSDAWRDNFDTIHSYEEIVTRYLDGQGIAVNAINILAADPTIARCEACICASGDTIQVEVPAHDWDDLENLGTEEFEKWHAY